MKFLAFDIETHKITPENESNLYQFRPLGISCAATFRSGDTAPKLWFNGCEDSVDPISEAMTKEQCGKLVNYLQEQLSGEYIPLTWNGLKFDFDILAEESGLVIECSELALSSIDMMFQFFMTKGYPIGISAVAKGLGLEGKTEGMHGDLAPVMWAENLESRLKVLEYVGQDSRLALQIAEKIIEKGYFNWIAKSGKTNFWFLAGKRWLTVKECLHLSIPDQSWMTKPIPIESFISWMTHDQLT